MKDTKDVKSTQQLKQRGLPPPPGLHEALLIIAALGEKMKSSKANKATR